MTHRFFLADVHLSVGQPGISAAFFAALREIGAQRPDAVYLVGDLFNAWLGDDVELQQPFARQVAAAIAALPCPVFFQHGNRDFLLSHEFARQAGLILLPDRHILSLGGQRILLEHGDLLCIHDRGYLRLRRVMRNKPLQRLYYRLPLAIKLFIARHLQSKSKARSARKNIRMTDADRGEVARVLACYGADILIHGHTHRPAIHDEGGKVRYVLGDWSAHGGIMLEYRHGLWRLHTLPVGEEKFV